MESFKDKVFEAVRFVQGRIAGRPHIGLLTGTGLGEGAAGLNNVVSIDCREIPHFPVSTVPTHQGRLLFGTVAGKAVMAMQGRLHYYEGYGMQEITLPVRVMQVLGVKTIVVSNASGGLNPEFHAGDIMIITDHINLSGNNPLVGPNIDEWGPRFPDMSRVYDRALICLAERSAAEQGIRVQKGVYAGLAGPSLETPAEIRFLRTIGADAVGMSTIPEVIAAVHAGMSILGLSVIANMNIPDRMRPVNIEQIIATAERTAPTLQALIRGVIERLD